MEQVKFRYSHLISGLFLLAIALCMVLSFRYINVETTAMLVIFNFLFASIIFLLDGALEKKLCILLAGNTIGLLWNYVFFLFAMAATDYFGKTFNTIYVIINPLLNLTWIVSFWSMSLTFLSNTRAKRQGWKRDY